MNRTMFTQLVYSKGHAAEEPSGLLVTMLADEEAGVDDQSFYVAREEAGDLIVMIAQGLDVDLSDVY